MIQWHGPMLVSDWLRSLHLECAIPPKELGAYVISQERWTKAPTGTCHPLYVGGLLKDTRSLGHRFTELFRDGFGFYHFGLVPGSHAGAQSLHEWCCKERTSLLDLWLGWCIADCHRCVEGAVYDHLRPSGTLLNKIRPSACGSHIPPISFAMSVAHRCPEH